MKEAIEILATPREVLQRIRSTSPWVAPLGFCTLIFFVLTWLSGCWQNLAHGLRWSNLLGPALISPMIVGIVSLGTTSFLYLVNLILVGDKDRSPGFRVLYSLNIHCGIAFLLGEVVNFLLVRTDLLGETGPPLPGRFPVGLDLLLVGSEEPNLYLAVLLHGTSVFVLWYLTLLALGLRIVSGTSKSRSLAIVLGLWCATMSLVLAAIYAAGGGTTIKIRI